LTADRFFAQYTRLRLQKIPVESITTKLKWEESDGGVFPHLYSDPLVGDIADDVEVLQWSRDDGRTWIQSAIHLKGLE
jgi:uncharacterized protein (DUF952 family)